jgi:ABC-type dipeptide/oligopeptide/nickel transport system ATPase component
MPGIKTAAPLLELDNLSCHYVSAQGTRTVRAVDEVSLRLNAGETLGIVGESGSGKSTLALTLMRVLPPAARIVGGRMMFEGEDLVQKSEEEMQHIRGKRIAMILQDPMVSLNPLFTIGDQVAEPIRVHEGARRASAWSRAEYQKAVRIAAPGGACASIPTSCPAGCVAHRQGDRAISCEPRVLIADEPDQPRSPRSRHRRYHKPCVTPARPQPGPIFIPTISQHRRQDATRLR